MTLHEDLHDLIERVIRTAFQAGYTAAQCDAEGTSFGRQDRYNGWRTHGPGALLPFGTGKAEPALVSVDVLGSNGPEVCVTHLCHVPCRIGMPTMASCAFSTDGRHTSVVRAYQQGDLSAEQAWRAIKAYPAMPLRYRPGGDAGEGKAK